MKKADNFNAKQWLIENKITFQSRLNENQVNNKYVFKDEEISDEDGDFYTIDQKKAFEYLKQFNNSEVSAKKFIKDDEGWGEFEQYLEDVEQMSDKELEDAMREEMSIYFFSNPDELGESKLNEDESNDVLTQEDFDILGNKGFEINFAQPRHQLFWLERKLNAERADFRYLENLLNKKNIPFRIEKRGYDGRGAAAKEIWIDTKYTDVPNPKVDPNE